MPVRQSLCAVMMSSMDISPLSIASTVMRAVMIFVRLAGATLSFMFFE